MQPLLDFGGRWALQAANFNYIQAANYMLVAIYLSEFSLEGSWSGWDQGTKGEQFDSDLDVVCLMLSFSCGYYAVSSVSVSAANRLA